MKHTALWVSKNSPILGSSVYPFTSDPAVSTMTVEDPYMQYPAATMSVPGRSTSANEGVPVKSF